jgi:hypothetical protein
MNSVSKAPISGAAKLLLVVLVVIGVFRMIDFIFYGYALRDLLSSIGFALLAYGLYANGLERTSQNRASWYASVAGTVLALAAAIMRYF